MRTERSFRRLKSCYSVKEEKAAVFLKQRKHRYCFKLKKERGFVSVCENTTLSNKLQIQQPSYSLILFLTFGSSLVSPRRLPLALHHCPPLRSTLSYLIFLLVVLDHVLSVSTCSLSVLTSSKFFRSFTLHFSSWPWPALTLLSCHRRLCMRRNEAFLFVFSNCWRSHFVSFLHSSLFLLFPACLPLAFFICLVVLTSFIDAVSSFTSSSGSALTTHQFSHHSWFLLLLLQDIWLCAVLFLLYIVSSLQSLILLSLSPSCLPFFSSSSSKIIISHNCDSSSSSSSRRRRRRRRRRRWWWWWWWWEQKKEKNRDKEASDIGRGSEQLSFFLNTSLFLAFCCDCLSSGQRAHNISLEGRRGVNDVKEKLRKYKGHIAHVGHANTTSANIVVAEHASEKNNGERKEAKIIDNPKQWCRLSHSQKSRKQRNCLTSSSHCSL